ncbi:molybdenum cofactor biosysynthesis protein [Alicyclobacillus cellulosilyticus]|uniref:Molybdenum cofactor biosysynthesis protein n=1 Tax=Alicyclobacillus cellulosilyticus TaxID=1003997 RepID=A0A917KE64_9BACL|nr:molybdenum cofactor biosysynthesis protein [Alicyclobacillus cellulosilyticus]
MCVTKTPTVRLQSIQVGRVQELSLLGQGRTFHSAFVKTPVQGPIWVHCTHLEGDEQADTLNHGGADKAILVYAASHYVSWLHEYPSIPFSPGGFGENFTVEGMDETVVCIGDVYQIGEAQFEVSQPRIPCWKISHRWQQSGLTERVAETGRTGWYFRVLRPGWVRAGMEVVRLAQPWPSWTIARLNGIIRQKEIDHNLITELVACPALSEAWRKMLHERLTSSIFRTRTADGEHAPQGDKP